MPGPPETSGSGYTLVNPPSEHTVTSPVKGAPWNMMTGASTQMEP